MKYAVSILATVLASMAGAEHSRQLDAHEHGVGALNIAFDGDRIVMEFRAPGADIVGFEHAAESAEDRSAIDDAVAALARPLDLFVIPEEAECSVTEASAALETEEAHDDHAEADHAHEHAEHKHEEHAHDHDDHAEEGGHSEFHADYRLTCGNPGAITRIDFAYFDHFENAREVEVQIVSAAGARAFEVERSAPRLDLADMF